MRGLDIISRTLTQRVPIGKQQQLWQYHPRSDRHSKVACWAILFDLMTNCSLLAAHAGRGVVAFGINHEMGDYHANRVKNLDLVVCRPGTSSRNGQRPRGFGALAVEYELQLDEGDKEVLSGVGCNDIPSALM